MVLGLDMRFLGGKEQKKNRAEGNNLDSVICGWGFELAVADLSQGGFRLPEWRCQWGSADRERS